MAKGLSEELFEELDAVKFYKEALSEGNLTPDELSALDLYAEGLYAIGKQLLDEAAFRSECPDGVTFLRAASELGHAGALYELGKLYETGWCLEKNKSEALLCFRRAAKKGHVKAGIKMADLIKDEADADDHVLVEKCLNKAASAGDHDAQTRLGMMYVNGDRVAKDVKRGRDLLISAAISGNTVARIFLPILFEKA
jgi:TPR repeat protein